MGESGLAGRRPDAAPAADPFFRVARVLFVASAGLLGGLLPLLLVVAGVVGGRPLAVASGVGLLSMATALAVMLHAGQRRLRRTLRQLARASGLALSELPDIVPGLAQLSLAGDVNGRWIRVGFENLPATGPVEYAAGQRWHGRRSRQHLVAATSLPTAATGHGADWTSLTLPPGQELRDAGLTAAEAARLAECRVARVRLGGGRVALAWDGRLGDEALADVARSLGVLAAIAARLERRDGADARCPLCGAAVPADPRYPRAVCADCVRRACDAQGRALDFFNAGAGGGLLAVCRDTGLPHPSQVCFIDGRRCRADEAKFGGIVVQPIEGDAPPAG
jgi:hypothetical protein